MVENQKIALHLGENSYEVLIGTGLLETAGTRLKTMGFDRRAVIITNPTVNRLHGQALQKSLAGAGIEADTLEVPDGEEYKTLETAGELYRQLGRLRAERQTPVMALGGGVIGDLAGFVAATYLRGVPYVQVPTTLLAQIDSSTGGKTAVDMAGLKNRIGAFYQPEVVLADVNTLKTLPPRELASGLAEVIKHAVIQDRDYFDFIESNMEKIRALEVPALIHIVTRSVAIKAGFVEKDERDTGIRNILNLGHTIGHAIESVSGFSLKHGEAVAIGLAAVCELARRMGVLGKDEAGRIRALLEQAGLPVAMPRLDKEKIMEVMVQDKKASGGRLRFILPMAIGTVFISDEVPLSLVREVIDG